MTVKSIFTPVNARASAGFAGATVEVAAAYIETGISFVDARSSISYVALTGTDYFLDSNLKLYTLLDTLSIADSALAFSFQFNRSATDSISATDVKTISVAKAATDSFSFADAIVIVWSPIRAFGDSATITDALGKSFAVAKADSVTPSESMVINFSKPLADSATMSDSPAKNLSKPFADSVTPTEAMVRDIGKSLAETLVMSDTPVIVNLSIETSVFNVSVLNSFHFNQ